ncbi:MAG: L-lysine 6-transaminase [Planctomycetota bacterium]|jgi:L-lysine 6-transaminase
MIDAKQVHETLRRHQLADGYPLVLDLEKSHGSWIHDAATGEEYLDCFTCFASWPLGYNHPAFSDAEYERELLIAAKTKVANSDLYTREMATFVEAFGKHVTPAGYPHHFWVSGGSLAVENAMKVAFDWKARKLGRTDFLQDCNDLSILHFEGAFHGRSGYTMSVTNTVPDKVGLFPKFPWPRVSSPGIEFDLDGGIANDVAALEARACAEIEAAFARSDTKIAGILIEPMQGEGGDKQFRTEFLQKLRDYADANEALLIFDEVQTGFFGSGKTWFWQHQGVAPDVVSFGKKSQVCGIYASKRVEEVEDHVFVKSSRINSTWGGNLVDMVRSRRFIDVIQGDNLTPRVAEIGDRMIGGLRSIAKDRGVISNVRGLGSLIAFTMESTESRDAMLGDLMKNKILALASGPVSVRFRLPFVMTDGEIDTALERIADSLPARV